MLLNPFQYVAPSTVAQAVDHLRQFPRTKILAGGTFVINQLKTYKKRGVDPVAQILSLRHLPGLADITVESHGVSIGAMVRLAQIASFTGFPKELAGLCCVAVISHQRRSVIWPPSAAMSWRVMCGQNSRSCYWRWMRNLYC